MFSLLSIPSTFYRTVFSPPPLHLLSLLYSFCNSVRFFSTPDRYLRVASISQLYLNLRFAVLNASPLPASHPRPSISPSPPQHQSILPTLPLFRPVPTPRSASFRRQSLLCSYSSPVHYLPPAAPTCSAWPVKSLLSISTDPLKSAWLAVSSARAFFYLQAHGPELTCAP